MTARLIPVVVHFDELDSLGMLHNSRYPPLVERAWMELWHGPGALVDREPRLAADISGVVVKELRMTYEAPVTRHGRYAVELWIEQIGTTSLTYGFRFCAADGDLTHAHGTRTVIRLDPGTLRPAPWSERLVSAGQELMR